MSVIMKWAADHGVPTGKHDFWAWMESQDSSWLAGLSRSSHDILCAIVRRAGSPTPTEDSSSWGDGPPEAVEQEMPEGQRRFWEFIMANRDSETPDSPSETSKQLEDGDDQHLSGCESASAWRQNRLADWLDDQCARVEIHRAGLKPPALASHYDLSRKPVEINLSGIRDWAYLRCTDCRVRPCFACLHFSGKGK